MYRIKYRTLYFPYPKNIILICVVALNSACNNDSAEALYCQNILRGETLADEACSRNFWILCEFIFANGVNQFFRESLFSRIVLKRKSKLKKKRLPSSKHASK